MAEALYTKIVDSLREEILSGRIRPGDQIPTEQELAISHGVSRITTTRAVKELENEGLIYRVQGRGTFVREESDWARNRRRTRLISFIVPFERQAGSGYALLNGAEAQAAAAQQLLTIHNSEQSYEKERRIIAQLMEHRTEGLVLFPLSSFANHDILSRLLIERTPLVVIDRRVLGIDASFVGVDNVGSMAEIVRHLASLGHRRIAFIAGTRTAMVSEQDRFIGFCRAMIEAGVPLREDYFVLADELPPSAERPAPIVSFHSVEVARQALELLFALPEPPTAVAVVNDMSAVNVLKAALQMGIQVPGQLSITGFDDLPVVSHLEVPLTTIAQPFTEIGETAVSVMQKLIQAPDSPAETRLLPTRLVVRESTAPPAGR
jgi:GntR family transcriptional regulator, arabinose operon transcriptional repressor